MSSNQRPDPDALLSKINEQEQRTLRGKLKIFFGAAAGVGKTYAMLAAAQQQRSQAVDVVLGVLETHGRRETEKMAQGLERLPLKSSNYRGTDLYEFDLDAALKRKPTLILMDELAHTNLCDTRHPKRWQDVEELLNAGIDVYTTVNVQHILSLNDVVGSITGIQVRETVPDHVFDEANEAVLVDLPPDELLQRLADGKVYLPEQAKQARRHFFRKGNLLALRELALRRTADRVDEQMRQYRRAQEVEPVWQARESMLVCVGPHTNAEQVVRNAARLAAQLACPWHAIYVETPRLQRLNDAARQRILLVLKTAQTLGAETATLVDHNEASAAAEYARQHNLSRVVVGHRSKTGLFNWRKTFVERLNRLAPELDVIQIAQTPKPSRHKPINTANVAQTVNWQHYLGSIAICMITTLLMIPLQQMLDLANGVMLFLLAVVGVALRFGRGPAVLAAFLSVGAFDFFFVPPRLSFSVADIQYVVTFVVMLSVALVIGQLMANLKFQARVANSREARARALYEMSRELSTALVPEQIAEISERSMQRVFNANTALLLPDLVGNLNLVNLPNTAVFSTNRLVGLGAQRLARPLPKVDLSIAQWAYDHEQAAGLSTDTLPAAPILYLPLKAPMRVRGVLALEPKNARWMQIPEQQRLLSTFAALIALALERVHYVDVAQHAQLNMESERLRNSVLAAVSHDLRTPLTALIGFADILLMKRSASVAEQQETVRIMRDLAERMNALVNNLLDMARLQAGGIKLNKQWLPLEEVIGTALRTTELTLGKRKLIVELPPELPLVEFDATLIERVLVNLLENAAKYTPPQAIVRITAAMQENQLEISVIDNGPGLPAEKEEAIFEKFTRGQIESTTPGIGLGLAICKTIVDAHGGLIRATSVTPHGAHFIFTLPQGSPPSLEGNLLP